MKYEGLAQSAKELVEACRLHVNYVYDYHQVILIYLIQMRPNVNKIEFEKLKRKLTVLQNIRS